MSQIFLSILILMFFSRVLWRFRKREIFVAEVGLWTFFCLVAELVILFADKVTYLANLLGITRGADLVLYVAFILVFYLLFKIVARQVKIERDITKIVRELALREKQD